MIEKAIEKIKEEMEKNKTPYVQAIGNYVLTQIEINLECAKEVVDEKKTLEEAFKKVTEEARKKAVNNCAVLTDEEVFKIVAKYYEFTNEQQNATKVVIVEQVEKKEEHKNFAVDLKSLLGGKRK